MIKNLLELLNLIPATHRWIVIVALVAGGTYYQTHKIEQVYSEEMRLNLEGIVQFVAKQKDCKNENPILK